MFNCVSFCVCLFAASFTTMAEKPAMNSIKTPALPPMASASVTATSGGGAMSLAQFEKLTTDGLIAWLASKEVLLDADEQAIFRKNKINGDGLTGMSKEDLKADVIPSGVVAQIMKRIPQ